MSELTSLTLAEARDALKAKNFSAAELADAQLAANFVLSREAQQFLTKRGRLPTRTDVETNPPGVIDALQQKKVIVTISSAEQQKKMQTSFNELFRAR